ncbi:nucleolar protein 6-like [Salvelinus fontinalis]|uniref:nucleolar protein 6-like n=1 Tax=Salvelinus fontinalis TaxID=8038 RepID=UPI0024856076|nr:nucleolar protein 6-like [Salvelinus fontinalis]
MDHSGNYVLTALPFILSFLQQVLGQRVRLLTHSLTPEPCRYTRNPCEVHCKDAGGSPQSVQEESLKVGQSYDDLSRKLEGVTLSNTSVQGSHPALRYTQVTPPDPHLDTFRGVPPPVPLKLDYSFFDREKLSWLLVPQEGKPCPVYIAVVKVIFHMEGNEKWPHDRVAVCHIKAAFHIGLGELPTKHHQPSPTHLDVWKDGLAFRIQVAYHREPQVQRESVCPEGLLIVRDNEEAQALEMATMHRPLLTCTGSSNSTRTLGRCVAWPSAGWELFSDDITEDTADLLVASLFLQPAPFTPPGSPRVGFLRFLHLLSSFDWRNNPRWSTSTTSSPAADYTEIKNDFIVSRVSACHVHCHAQRQEAVNLDQTGSI